MRNTRTVALLPLPLAAWNVIAQRLEASGYDAHHITTDAAGTPTVAIDLHGISIIPEGDADSFHNAGRLSDHLIAVGEEAFTAGYEAAKAGVPLSKAWDRYTPSEELTSANL